MLENIEIAILSYQSPGRGTTTRNLAPPPLLACPSVFTTTEGHGNKARGARTGLAERRGCPGYNQVCVGKDKIVKTNLSKLFGYRFLGELTLLGWLCLSG